MNNQLIVLRGEPGAGKSTYAMNHFPDFECFEADMWFSRNGEYKFDPSQLYQAHMWCQNKVKTALVSGENVVVANTNVKLRDMRFYIDTAKALAIPFRVIRLTTQFQNVHGVPAEKVRQMREGMQPYPGEEIV